MNSIPNAMDISVVMTVEELKTVLWSCEGKNLIIDVSSPNLDRIIISPIDEIKAVANPMSSLGKILAARSQNKNPEIERVNDVKVINNEF